MVSRFLKGAMMLGALWACSEEDPNIKKGGRNVTPIENNDAEAQSDAEANGKETKTETSGSADQVNQDDTTSDASPDGSTSSPTGGAGIGGLPKTGSGTTGSTDEGGDTTGDTGGTDPNAPFTAQAYFDGILYPLLREQCIACHVGPRVAVNPRGPLNIYNFDDLKGWVDTGASSTNNHFINKALDRQSHTGGDRCGGSVENSPCKEFIEFYLGIKGPDDPNALNITGQVSSHQPDGQILGYAYDPNDTAATISLEIYKNTTPDQGGTPIATIQANSPGQDNLTPGNHAFIFTIPRDQIDHGLQMSIYVYAVVGDNRSLIGNGSYSMTAYVPQADGEAYFNANLANDLNGGACSGCHGTKSYEAFWSSLVRPGADQGGSATNNTLYGKVSASAAFGGHGGGNRCQGNRCPNIQTWWQMEFGAN